MSPAFRSSSTSCQLNGLRPKMSLVNMTLQTIPELAEINIET